MRAPQARLPLLHPRLRPPDDQLDQAARPPRLPPPAQPRGAAPPSGRPRLGGPGAPAALPAALHAAPHEEVQARPLGQGGALQGQEGDRLVRLVAPGLKQRGLSLPLTHSGI
jgi:hypothetical protein